MKRLLFFFLFLSTVAHPTHAQTQAEPVLVGTASEGADGFGTIFQFTPASSSATSSTVTPTVFRLTGNPGANPQYSQLTLLNGKLYGMTRNGGTTDEGIIFEYDPATDTYTKKKDFALVDGRLPLGSLTAYNNKLYGLTWSGGTPTVGTGTLFEFDPVTNVYTKKKEFVNGGADGSQPYGSLTVYNNKLYGMSNTGGATNRGVIFEFDPATGTFTKKKDFSATDGAYPYYGALTVYNNKLYGLTSAGGASDSGVLFEFDPATSAYTKRKEFVFSGTGSEDGSTPYGSLTVFNNKLYGMTRRSAAGNNGSLFEFDPATNTFTKKKDMSAIGGFSFGSFTVLGSELVAFTYYQIFSYNPATNAHTIRKEYSFLNRQTEGSDVYSSPTVFNNLIYGMTMNGGSNGEGVLFSLNPANNAYTMKKSFSGSNGSNPTGGMIYYNSKLYGMTSLGGASGVGALYEYDPVTRIYTNKKDFSTTDGAMPYGALLAYNCKLYGLTYQGGTGDGGVLFEYDPATNGYVRKRDFNSFTSNPNGARPYGSLAVWNNKLFGITYYGGTGGLAGTSGNGVIFEFDLATNIYTKKKDLLPEDGVSFYGRLTLFNNKFYGLMNRLGGVVGGGGTGTLFEYDPATNVFTKKKDLGSVDAPSGGANGSLTVFNNKLYGLAGAASNGPLFEYEPVSNIYTSRNPFPSASPNPWRPTGSLISFRGKLYGMTKLGGTANQGAVFSYDPVSFSITTVFSFTSNTTGTNPEYGQLVAFPDCQLSATASVASVSMCVNDGMAVSVSVTGQNCQPTYNWTSDALSRLTNPANTSALSATALQSGVRSFSVTVTESLCSVSTSTTANAFDISSVQNGNWNDPSTWNCGRIPIRLDIVKVRHDVTVPASYVANALQLRFESTARLIYGLQTRMRLSVLP